MLEFKKCIFFSDLVEYIGHIVRLGSIKVDCISIALLCDAKPPSNNKQQNETAIFPQIVQHLLTIHRQLLQVAASTQQTSNEGKPQQVQTLQRTNGIILTIHRSHMLPSCPLITTTRSSVLPEQGRHGLWSRFYTFPGTPLRNPQTHWLLVSFIARC